MSKYKVGDRVSIKMGLNWILEVRDAINRLSNNTATIKEVYVSGGCDYYYMKEIDWNWKESEIKELVLELKIEVTRFELMEL